MLVATNGRCLTSEIDFWTVGGRDPICQGRPPLVSPRLWKDDIRTSPRFLYLFSYLRPGLWQKATKGCFLFKGGKKKQLMNQSNEVIFGAIAQHGCVCVERGERCVCVCGGGGRFCSINGTYIFFLR